MPDETFVPSITLEDLDISVDKNFDNWLNIIKHAIYYLKRLNDDVNGDDGLQTIIEEAESRNQITECLPNNTQYNCNKIVTNGIYYVKYDSSKTSQHLPTKNDYIIYASKTCTEENIVQLAFKMSKEDPTIYVRVGITGENGLSFSSWIRQAGYDWVYNNFLRTKDSADQTVASKVTFNNNVEITGDNETSTDTLTVQGNTLLSGVVKIRQNESDYKGIVLKNTNEDFTIETNKNPHVNNYPIYPEYGNVNSEYQKPLEISHATEICNINGTANYANFINPEYMVSTFKPEDLSGYMGNYPVTASAVSALYSFGQETYMHKAGGTFTGIVNHTEDIFLRHIKNSQDRRTAALRSPDGELNLQCQTTTNVISTSKQCELYLEKEDVDTAEYTKKEVSFSFNIYNVEWDKETIRTQNPEYSITYAENVLTTSIGEIILNDDGSFSFNGNESLIRQIDENNTYAITLYYKILNKIGNIETTVSNNNEYTFRIDNNTGISFSGKVTINASHYIVVFTKTDYENLPIESSSLITAGSILTDGTVIASNSELGNYRYTENETVIGNRIIEESLVTGGTILKAGSIIAKGTTIHRIEGDAPISTKFNFTSPLRSDIEIYPDNENNEYSTILLPGTVIKSGSTIKSGSNINGVEYSEDKEINGLELTQDLVIRKGSSLHIGTNIAIGSILNYNYDNGSYGIKVTDDSYISTGSMLKKGSVVAVGSILYSGMYPDGFHLFTETDDNVLHENIQINAHGSTLLAGSIIEIGSIIAGGSKINNISSNVKRTISCNEYTGILTKANLAPKMYICEYNNVLDNYSQWTEYAYDKIFQNATYDEDLWKERIISIINNLKNQENSKLEIIDDLNNIFLSSDRPYPLLNNLFNKETIIRSGKYIATKTALNNPQNEYDEYVYVSRLDKSISLNDIVMEITSTNPPRKYVIYSTISGEPVVITPISCTFTYSDFLIKRIGSTYTISFKYMISKSMNQYDQNADSFYEDIRFLFNYNSSDNSSEYVTDIVRLSFDANHMFNSACVIGARTRTGITKEGEFGDPLYDLGCVEFGEAYTAIRLRKKNVTTLQNINPDMAVILENSPRIAFRPEYIEYKNQTTTSYSYTTAENKSGMISLGTPDSRFDTVYVKTSTIETSDKSQKTNIKDIPAKLLDAWKDVKWITYKLKDAVEQKGKNARIHTGVIAQDVETALSKVDLEKYGFFCKDKWDDEYETKTITIPKHTDSLGIERDTRIEDVKVLTKKKGEQYAIRYQEMQAIENMYLRREIELLKKEIESLKEKIK